MPNKYYLESSIVCEILERDKNDPLIVPVWNFFESATKKQCELVASVLSMAEAVMSRTETHVNKSKTVWSEEVQSRLDLLWHPDSSPVQLVAVHEMVVRDAVSMFRHHMRTEGKSKSKGIDLSHLLTAKSEGVTHFISTEKKMKSWQKEMGFLVWDLEDLRDQYRKSQSEDSLYATKH